MTANRREGDTILMPKKMIFRFLCRLFFVLFLFPLVAGAEREEIKNPESLVKGLDHLFSEMHSLQQNPLNLKIISEVLDFVAHPKSRQGIYREDNRFNAPSAYHHFDIQTNLTRILRYAYNPAIPSYAFAPSSVRVSSWKSTRGQTKPRLWEHLPAPERPIILKNTEIEENTPDLFTGSYYRYEMDRTLILCRHKGHNVFISLSKQTKPSGVGKKGLRLGRDEDWDYLYSGREGLNITGMGWVKSYVYDSASVTVFYELDKEKGLVRCGVFRWLRAGWAGLNVVNGRHIRKGLKRYARDFKAIMEMPSLPRPDKMAEVFSSLSRLCKPELKVKIRHYLDGVSNRHETNKAFSKKGFADQFRSEKYLQQMTREEMVALLVLETMKYMLDRTGYLDKALLPYVGYIGKQTHTSKDRGS